jgi:EAL domain-containing protein (putative c-di-GMP-specific phosphodiesterase class I)
MVVFALEVGSTTIIAERVETADELRTITSLGIDAAQGYLLGRPTATETAWDR